MSENVETFERVVNGNSESIQHLLRIFAYEFRSERGSVYFEQNQGRALAEFGPALSLRKRAGNEIGRISLVDLAGGRVLLHQLPIKSEQDPDGSHLTEFLEYAVRRFEDYGLVARRSKFACAGMVDSAIRQLAAADTPEAFASIGNTCRLAMVALGKELFKPTMLEPGEQAPKGDAAVSNLKTVARVYWGAGRQLDGMKQIIDGAWGLCSAVPHDATATREGAELALGATVYLFDMFALISP